VAGSLTLLSVLHKSHGIRWSFELLILHVASPLRIAVKVTTAVEVGVVQTW